ncbi:TOBE domain-containing protein [Desulfovibrio sp. OttesenSCG-928-F20]|nr:TOBE domain-containing protein [Desulfovibrio sp. OttesenSCG-928-M16]MDL2291379.1 TOBE domain-containing protein [Desulfovibrio sp. OttesenSCG-928-F20]
MSTSEFIVSNQDAAPLAPLQLESLEVAFLAWAAQARGGARYASRCRILLIFLLIRYTGAKLSEVLGLNPDKDIDLVGRVIAFHGSDGQPDRIVHVSEHSAAMVAELLPLIKTAKDRCFNVDPAFVRRKFYERAEECGFDKTRGGPEMIRKARAVELMSNNMPLPVVQRLLGHSSPNQTSSYMSFSDEDMANVARLYMEREGGRKSSARNSFYGKVRRVEKGGVQSRVELDTPDGQSLVTLVTNTSVERLGLEPGRLIGAEVKAPWLTLERCDRPGTSSAENCREGHICRIMADAINTECAVSLPDGTELCAIVSTQGFAKLDLGVGDAARVLFGAYAVILQTQ